MVLGALTSAAQLRIGWAPGMSWEAATGIDGSLRTARITAGTVRIGSCSAGWQADRNNERE